jgi:hypothetical protein
MWPIDRTAEGNVVGARWIDSLDLLPFWMSFDPATVTLSGTPVVIPDPEGRESVSGYVWFSFQNPTTLPNQTHWVAVPLTVEGNRPPRPFNMAWNPELGFVQEATSEAIPEQYWSMQLSALNGSEIVDADNTSFILQSDSKYEFNGTGFSGPDWVRFNFARVLIEGTPGLSDAGTVGYVTIKAKDFELSEARWKIRVSVRDPSQTTTVGPTVLPTGTETGTPTTPTATPTETGGGGGSTDSGPNVGAIVGGVFGALIGVGLIAGGFYYYNRNKKRSMEDGGDEKAEKAANWDSHSDAKGGSGSPTNSPGGDSSFNGGGAENLVTGNVSFKATTVPMEVAAKSTVSSVPSNIGKAAAGGVAAVAAALGLSSTPSSVKKTPPAISPINVAPSSPILPSVSLGDSLSSDLGISIPPTNSPVTGTRTSPPTMSYNDSSTRSLVTPLDVSGIPLSGLVAAGGKATTPPGTSSGTPTATTGNIIKIEPIFAVPVAPASLGSSAAQLPPVAVIIPPQIVKQQSKENLVAALTYISPEGGQTRPESSGSSQPNPLSKKDSNISLARSTVSSNPSLHKKASSSSLTRVVPPQVIPSPSEQAVKASKSPLATEDDALAAKEAALRELHAKEAQAETQRLLAEAQQQIAKQQQTEQGTAINAAALSPSGSLNRKSVSPKLAPLTLPFAAGATVAAATVPNEPTPKSEAPVILDDDSEEDEIAAATAAVKEATSATAGLSEAEIAQLSQVKAMLSGSRAQFYEPGNMMRSRSPTRSAPASMPPSPNPLGPRQGQALFDMSRSASRENLSGVAGIARSGMTTPVWSMPSSPSTRSLFGGADVDPATISAASGKYSVVDGLPCAELVAKIGKPFFYLPLSIQQPQAATPVAGAPILLVYSLKPHAPATASPRWLKIHYRTGGVSGLPYNNDKGEFLVDVVRTEKESGREEIVEVVKVQVVPESEMTPTDGGPEA